MDELLAAMLIWLNDNADYTIDGISLPAVQEMSAGELTAKLPGKPKGSVSTSDVNPRVFALYSREDGPHGTIFIVEAASTPGLQAGEPPLENPVFRERLLHELVHHVLFHTSAYTAFHCPSMGEVDALRLGALYLRAHHANDPFPQRWARIHAATQCRISEAWLRG